MKLKDLLDIQLQIDIFKDLDQLYNSELGITYEEYRERYIQKYNQSNKDIKLDKGGYCNYNSETRCCARIWDSHYGTRCRYKRFENTEYCKHHDKTIKRRGELLFNRYDEDRPIYNEKGNIIPWFEDTNMEMLDNIVQKQHDKMIKLINK